MLRFPINFTLTRSTTLATIPTTPNITCNWCNVDEIDRPLRQNHWNLQWIHDHSRAHRRLLRSERCTVASQIFHKNAWRKTCPWSKVVVSEYVFALNLWADRQSLEADANKELLPFRIRYKRSTFPCSVVIRWILVQQRMERPIHATTAMLLRSRLCDSLKVTTAESRVPIVLLVFTNLISKAWLTKQTAIIVTVGTIAQIKAVFLHEVKAPNSKTRKIPIVAAIPEVAISTPRTDGSLKRSRGHKDIKSWTH